MSILLIRFLVDIDWLGALLLLQDSLNSVYIRVVVLLLVIRIIFYDIKHHLQLSAERRKDLLCCLILFHTRYLVKFSQVFQMIDASLNVDELSRGFIVLQTEPLELIRGPRQILLDLIQPSSLSCKVILIIFVVLESLFDLFFLSL